MNNKSNRYLGITALSALLTLTAITGGQSTDATLLPNAIQYFMDANGKPLANGKVFMYTPSTTTPKTTWTTADKAVPQANPIPLGISGKPANPIYGDGSYRQKVVDQFNNTIWDFTTASTGGGGGTPVVPTVGDGNIVGTVLPWSGLVAPPNYVFAYGQSLLRADYPLFLATVTISTSMICTSGLNVLSGISDTQNIRIGAPVEASCVPPGTTVTAVATTSVTISANASISTAVIGTFFPYGNGNGSTTFAVPDLRGLTIVGRQNMGGTVRTVPNTPIPVPYWNLDGSNANALGAQGGSSNHPMSVSNLPPYTPGGVITNGAITSTFTGQSGQTGLSGAGGAQAYASGAFASSQIIGTVVSTQATTTFAGTAQGGTTVPFPTVQPSVTLNYVIKILPDVSTVVASGVASIGGMTGVIACGAGITCAANTISTVGTGVPAVNVTFQQTGTGAIITTLDDLLRTKYYTPQMFGALCNGVADDALPLQAALNALPSFGGNIRTPQGSTCMFSTTLTIPVPSVTLEGDTVKNEKNALPSTWVYTGTGARAIDARDSFALNILGMKIVYSSVSSFTGSLIDLSATIPGTTISGYPVIKDSYLGPSTNRTGTATLINISQGVDVTVAHNYISHGAPAIQGATVLGQNVRTNILNNTIVLNDTMAISGCGEAWRVEGNSFEPAANGTARAFSTTSLLPCNAMVWANNWFGDVTAIGGTWVSGWFNGLEFIGNRMAGDIIGPSSNGLSLNTSTGVHIAGNNFDALANAINCTTAVAGLDITGNRFGGSFGSTVTTPLANSSNCTNVTTDNNSPSISRVAAGQINVGQTSADPLPKTFSGAGTLSTAGALTVNLGAGATVTGLLPNANLANPATTVNGQTCTLGAACTVVAAATSVSVGTTTISSGTNTRVLFDNAGVLGEYSISGTGNVAMTTNPIFVTPALGTPASAVGTNFTGTAAGLTAGNVTTNANLTGPVTSVGNATTITNNAVTYAKMQQATGSALLGVAVAGSLANYAPIAPGNVDQVMRSNFDGTSIGFGSINLGATPTVGTSVLLAANGGTGLTALGTGVATWFATPSSANLAAAVTDETGSGALVFGTTPTLATPIINGLPTGTGVASANTVSTLVARDGSGNFSAGTITAALSGNATSATSATNATNTAITDDTTTNATMNLTWVTSNSGNLPQKTTSTKLTFNPSTGVLSSTSFTGAGTGLTGTAASLTSGNVTTNANLTGAVTSVGNATSLGSFSSANLSSALTDETGSGVAVFGTSPILTTVDARGTWTTGTSWTLPAHTLAGTISGGGNSINNVVIGASTPLAGTFTTVNATTVAATLSDNANNYLLAVTNSNAGANALAGASFSNNTNALTFQQNGLNKSYGASANGDGMVRGTAAGFVIMSDNAAGTIKFATGGSTETSRLSASGGFSIGNTTDPGAGGLRATGATIQFTALASDAAQTDSNVCVNSSGTLLKGSGTLGVCLGTSSARFKHDIVSMGAGLAEIVRLAPKNFFYKKGFGDDGKRQQYGFIAEDVVKVLPGVTAPDAKGAPQSVDMLAMVPVLVNAVKELKADNDNLRAELKTLKQAQGGK